MEIKIQNVGYKSYNLQKTNEQKASDFIVPKNTTNSLNILSNYNKADIQFKGLISDVFKQCKERGSFPIKKTNLHYDLEHGVDKNGNDLFPSKMFIRDIVSSCEPYNVDLITRICFDKKRDETIFDMDCQIRKAAFSLSKENIDLAERLFFPDKETKEIIKKYSKEVDFFGCLDEINEDNKELAEKLLFNKDLFPQKAYIERILSETNEDNIDLAEKLCLGKDEEGKDIFPYKHVINTVLRHTTQKNKNFIERFCCTKIDFLKEDKIPSFIDDIVWRIKDINVDCAEELYFGTNNSNQPLLKDKTKLPDIMHYAQNEQKVKKLKSFIKLLKEEKIPEGIIFLFLSKRVSPKDYENALNVLGKEKIFSLRSEQLWSAINFVGLYNKKDVSELSEMSLQDRKKLFNQITKQGVQNFDENNELLKDFPLIPTDAKSYSRIITALTKSINIQTEKISFEDEQNFNKALLSLATTLSTLTDEEFDKIQKPLSNNTIKNDVEQITSVFPELNETLDIKQFSTQELNEFKHSLKVMQGIAQNPNYKKLNDSDKKILLLASFFHDYSKSERDSNEYHAENSASDTYFIIQKLNLSKSEQNKLYSLIKHHEWLSNIDNPVQTDKEKTKKSIAYDLQYQNLFKLSKIFIEADLKATNEYDEKKAVFNKYSSQIDKLIDELKDTQPLLPITEFPSASRIKKAITQIKEDGTTDLKGIYQDKNGLIIVRYNEVENETWEKIGFPKGSISKGIETFSTKGEKIDTGNIKFFAHGLEIMNDIQNFDAFCLPDSDALLSVSYAERPESKFRFYRTNGILLKTTASNIHGGGKSDSGSGCKKSISDFKENGAFPLTEYYDERKFVSDLIKKYLHLFNGQYKKLIDENANKPLCEFKPEKYQEKIIKALATINSHIRRGERSYNEMFISNPEVMAVYAYPFGDKIGDTMHFVKKQDKVLKEYALEKDIPMFIFGD